MHRDLLILSGKYKRYVQASDSSIHCLRSTRHVLRVLYNNKPQHVTSLWWLLAPWHIQPKHQLAFIRELHHLKSLLEIQNISIVTPYSTQQGLLNRYSKYEALLMHHTTDYHLPGQVVTTCPPPNIPHDLAH